MEIPCPQGSPTAPQLPRPARKGAGTRAWLVLGGASEGSHVEELGKHAIMKRTGLPARDLRILDPALSYPSTVLGRERAIVVKLEHIKAVITAQEVLVQNPRDPLVAPFVSDLLVRLTAGDKNAAAPTIPLTSEPYKQAGESSPNDSSGMDGSTAKASYGISLDKGSSTNLDMKDGYLSKVEGTRELPFEFKALEASLEYACRSLESETSTLEKEAYPALDALTLKISTLHLERVRQIKSRLVAISGRVQKVRDELENLLDDDMDMAEMYLTEKLYRHETDEISMDQIDGGASEPDECDENVTNKDRESVQSIGFSPNIEDLEMLLEAYFVQIEGTLNKLSTLREYVDDTEDYINIMLDDKQNQLLQMGVMLSTATMLVSAGIAVVGLFGMNIHISLYATASTSKFWETASGSAISCMILFIVALAWGKRKGLLS